MGVIARLFGLEQRQPDDPLTPIDGPAPNIVSAVGTATGSMFSSSAGGAEAAMQRAMQAAVADAIAAGVSMDDTDAMAARIRAAVARERERQARVQAALQELEFNTPQS